MPKDRPFLWAVSLALLCLAVTVFAVDIDEALFILSMFVPLVCGVPVLGALVLLLRSGLHERSARHFLAGAVLISVALACCFNSQALSTQGRFVIVRPYYERQVGLVHSGALHESDSIIVEGKLIGFYWYRGVTDNWVGLVYDPDDGLDRSYSEEMFGGDLVSVTRLQRYWFLCLFT